MTEFNHIHCIADGQWVCARAMAFDDQELLCCEARHDREEEACRQCASQVLAYFGDSVYIQ